MLCILFFYSINWFAGIGILHKSSQGFRSEIQTANQMQWRHQFFFQRDGLFMGQRYCRMKDLKLGPGQTRILPRGRGGAGLNQKSFFNFNKAQISRNFIPERIFILLETFSAHFVNDIFQQL